jgi:hypothetical protein
MNGLIIILCVVLGFTGGVLFSFFEPFGYSHKKVILEKSSVYVDAERVIRHVIDELQKNNIPKKDMEKAVMESKAKFQKELKYYSRSHNVIIFSSPKAIVGAEDVTEYFIERLP